MKAVVQDTYGSPEVLEIREIDKPAPNDDEVLVRVHAAGVDPGVWHLMTGRPYLVRVMGEAGGGQAVGLRSGSGDRKELPGTVDTLQGMRSPVLGCDVGAHHQVSDGP
jgi:NADPH:quinone reductase-like Zn-dependent oxidoreductase